MTPPLSYGYWKSAPEKKGWELKGFELGKNLLYNLPGLKENPTATVLIVEGEKTADAALSKISEGNFVCITWPGGAGAARRADWSPLIGRNALIWPDNDKAGFQAAEDVCRELRRIGVYSLRLVNPQLLQKNFPEKWDLADPFPSSMNPELPKQLLLSILEKGIDPQQLLYRLSSIYKNNPVDLARVNEILWRVDERIRPELEKQGESMLKIRETILTESVRILLQHQKWQESYAKESTDLKSSAGHLAWQISIHEAQYGKKPTTWERETIQAVVEKYAFVQGGEDKKLQSFAMDKALAAACEKAIAGVELTVQGFMENLDNSMRFARLQIMEKGIQLDQKDLIY